MKFAGAVLAGGKSSRMGRNKALLRIEGEPLWRRQMRVLKEAGADPVWIVQAQRQRALTRGVLRDSFHEAGPLAGLHAALAQCHGSHLAVAAVDLPHLEPAWFTRLAKLCAPGCGAVARTRDGYEPLAAIYPKEAILDVEARLNERALTLQELVATLVRSRRMRVLHLKAAECRSLMNWNSPIDISQAPAVSPSRSFRKPKANAGAPVRN